MKHLFRLISFCIMVVNISSISINAANITNYTSDNIKYNSNRYNHAINHYTNNNTIIDSRLMENELINKTAKINKINVTEYFNNFYSKKYIMLNNTTNVDNYNELLKKIPTNNIQDVICNLACIIF